MQTLTSEGAPIGSPAFMAPEQARGERGQMSTRTDVYGLGATACYVLTGQTPHDTGTTLHSAIQRVAYEEPRDPRLLDPSLPRPLAAVLSKATARNPADRYESAAAFAADLRRWATGEPVLAGSPGLWARALRWAARRPLLATTTTCATAGLLILGSTAGTVWWINERPDRIDIAKGQSVAHLRTISGRELMRWGTGEPGSVVAAELVRRPSGLGGERMALLSITGAPPAGTGGQLTAYALSDFSRPLWSAPALAPEIQAPAFPPDITWNSASDDEYRASTVLVADIFPDHPGLEIAVVHYHHCCTPNAIRVYSLAGEVLYEVWHLGPIFGLQWLESSGLLIANAHRHGLDWTTLGFDYWPHVIFAIRPRQGVLHRDGWLNATGRFNFTPTDVEWYQYLMPPDKAPWAIMLVEANRQAHPGAFYVQLRFDPADVRVSFSLLMDSNGRTIAGGEQVGDFYRTQMQNERPASTYSFADAVDVCGLTVPRAGEGR
jgi:hypothetical protein